MGGPGTSGRLELGNLIHIKGSCHAPVTGPCSPGLSSAHMLVDACWASGFSAVRPKADLEKRKWLALEQDRRTVSRARHQLCQIEPYGLSKLMDTYVGTRKVDIRVSWLLIVRWEWVVGWGSTLSETMKKGMGWRVYEGKTRKGDNLWNINN